MEIILVEYWRIPMATLNIKKFPDALYDKLRARAESRHRSISQEVIHLINQVIQEHESHSILELRGLGKKHWKDIEPDEHIEKERRKWD
jgi:plasmid stability protein